MSGPNDLPDTKALQQLPALCSMVIPERWQDQNGHVNVSFYMALYLDAGWPMLDLVGIDKSYFSERQMGFVDLENHFRYLSELHVGNRVTAYGRYLAHDSKRIHGIVLTVNEDTAVLASMTEFLAISLDLQTRRAADIPQDIVARISEVTRTHRELPWTVPTRLSLSAKKDAT